MRKTQNKLGHPSMRTYLKVVKNNLLPNFPINREGVLAAEDICYKDQPLKAEIVSVPPQIIQKCKLVHQQDRKFYIFNRIFEVCYRPDGC